MALDEAQEVRLGHAPCTTPRRRTTIACPTKPASLKIDPTAAYAYFTSNETIQGRAVPRRTGRPARSAAGLRCVERFPLPAAADGALRPDLLLRSEELRPRRRDDRDHSRRLARPLDRQAADDDELHALREGKIAAEHAAGVLDLHHDARHALAEERHRRPRQDARAQQEEGQAAVRRDRRLATASTRATPRRTTAR